MEGNILQGIVTTTDDLPTKDIKETWDQDKIVTQLTSYENKWVLLVESSQGCTQSYAGNSDWPGNKIIEKYESKFHISSVAYNQEVEAWSVIFDKKKNGNPTKQIVSLITDFPEPTLKELGVSRYGTRFL